MSYSIWLDETKDKKNYDVVIIGAGIAGASAAYWLKKEDSSLKIAVLDRSTIAGGASGRNAGFITCGSVEHFNRLVGKHGREEAYEIWNFSEKNLELLKQEVIKDKSDYFGFAHKGSFSLASTDAEFAELKETAKIMEEMNIAVETIEQSGIESRLGASEFVGGIKYVKDASVNPVLLTQEILKLSGADIFEHTEVSRVEETSGTRTIHTQNGSFETSIVVYATNGYSTLLNKYFSDKIFATRGQILVTEPVEPFMESPCYANFVLDYFRQLPSGHLLIGGFRQLEKETEVGYSNHTTDVIQDALYDFVVKHLPKFKNQKVLHRWGGVMGFSVDGQPMVGSLPEDPQSFFLGGFTAHGIGLAFQTGKSMVDMMYDREIPDFISAKRFS